jgi:hypothetical protein
MGATLVGFGRSDNDPTFARANRDQQPHSAGLAEGRRGAYRCGPSQDPWRLGGNRVANSYLGRGTSSQDIDPAMPEGWPSG